MIPKFKTKRKEFGFFITEQMEMLVFRASSLGKTTLVSTSLSEDEFYYVVMMSLDHVKGTSEEFKAGGWRIWIPIVKEFLQRKGGDLIWSPKDIDNRIEEYDADKPEDQWIEEVVMYLIPSEHERALLVEDQDVKDALTRGKAEAEMCSRKIDEIRAERAAAKEASSQTIH